MAKAAALRTKSRRLMLNRRRTRSVSMSANRMISICRGDGGGGSNSPLEQGRTSTGRSSASSSSRGLRALFGMCVLAPYFEGPSHRGMDAAVVGDDLAGLVARGGGDGQGH